MSSADWQLDPAELASKFSERTKAIVLNSPNNPLGKVTLLAMLGPGGSWVPHLQGSSASALLAHRGSGCCGSPTCCAQFPGGFKPCVLCQQSQLLDHCSSSCPPWHGRWGQDDTHNLQGQAGAQKRSCCASAAPRACCRCSAAGSWG